MDRKDQEKYKKHIAKNNKKYHWSNPLILKSMFVLKKIGLHRKSKNKTINFKEEFIKA